MAEDFKTRIAGTLQPLVASATEKIGLQPLRVVVRGAEHTPVIEVVIDGDRDVTIEDCSSVSRDLNGAIEEGSLLKGNFRLDVMSPGTEEPLVHHWQFKRNIGRLIRFELLDGTKHLGRLQSLTTDKVVIEPKAPGRPTGRKPAESTALELSSIRSAAVEVEFNRNPSPEE